MNYINYVSYLTIFKIRFINGLQYRIAAWAGLATQFFWGFLNILLFYAFYSENPAKFPMTFEQFAAYTWLQQAFLMMFSTAGWHGDSGVFNDIMSGNIAYELTRPIDLYNMWIMRNMATRISGAVLRCMPVLIVAFLLPKPFKLILPEDIFTFGLFIVSAVFAFVLVCTFNMFYYIIAFYTINATGIITMITGIIFLLSGFIIPLPFFPEKIFKIVNILPFASMQNITYFIYSGYISKNEALLKIFAQFIWIIIFYLTGKILMKRALRKVIVQGG